MKHSTNAFGSRLDITIADTHSNITDIKKCFEIVERFEQKYSRFISGNFLDTLNKTKSSAIDEELFQILRFSIKLSALSDGYFDITLLPILENIGYGIHQEILPEDIGYKNIILSSGKVELKNNVSLDLGAIGKGYIVDKIYNFLQKKYTNFVINFGGDIRVSGEKEVFLEDPYDPKKHIGKINLSGCSLASSSAQKRKIQQSSHLINPKNKEDSGEILTLFVQHKLCCFADGFSTLLFVTPLKQSLKILESTKGLEALIILTSGEIYKSSGFNCELYTND